MQRNLGVALSTERRRTSNERIVLPERKVQSALLPVDNAGVLVTRQFSGISGGVVEVLVLVKEPLNLGVREKHVLWIGVWDQKPDTVLIRGARVA